MSVFASADSLLPPLPPRPEASTARITVAAGNAQVELTPQRRKREGYRLSAGYEERCAHQRRDASQKRLDPSIASLQVTVNSSYALLPKSFNGASGSRSKALKNEVDLLRSNTTFRLAMLKTFRAIPYR
jgi:hypothetical protein